MLGAVEDLRRDPSPFRALLLRISGLSAYSRAKGKLELVAHLIGELAKNGANNTVFYLSSGDLIFLGANIGAERLTEVAVRASGFFSDDPLLQRGRENFARIFDLSSQFAEFDQEAHALAEAATDSPQPGVKAAPEMTPQTLDHLAELIPHIDMRRILRWQNVYDFKTSTVLFRGHYASSRAISQAFSTNVDLFSDRWLFSHLTLGLDRVLLQYLTAHPPAGPVSFNLNLASLPLLKSVPFSDITLELNLPDIVMNLQQYREITGAKKLIKQVSFDALTCCNLAELSPDYVKLVWQPEFADRARRVVMADRLAGIGLHRVILTHCQTKAAVDWGMEMGIGRYQGFWLDQRLEGETR
ncbi:diguanylate phosphodiesterase [Alphaproteobacteria bacterium]|nr:diguanylate phosphodiesterase [Alphaproteobacteria bacterium]